jgi:hypothetical protein
LPLAAFKMQRKFNRANLKTKALSDLFGKANRTRDEPSRARPLWGCNQLLKRFVNYIA